MRKLTLALLILGSLLIGCGPPGDDDVADMLMWERYSLPLTVAQITRQSNHLGLVTPHPIVRTALAVDTTPMFTLSVSQALTLTITPTSTITPTLTPTTTITPAH